MNGCRIIKDTMKSNEVRKLLNCSQKVLVGYHKRGEIKVIKCSDGTYDYDDDDVHYIKNNPKNKPSDKIVLIDPKTESVYKTYNGATEATHDLGIKRQGITHCLNHDVNIHHGYILKYERDATPENISLYSEKYNYAIDGTRRCYKCKDWYEVEKFMGDYCIGCERKRLFALRSTFNGFFKKLARMMIHSSAGKTKKGRIDAGICEIDHVHLQQLYNDQDGCCYYSGIKLSTAPLSDWQASPERLDTDMGYIQDNVKLICLEFNTGHTQWSKEKIKLAKVMSKRKVDQIVLAESVESAKTVTKVPKRKKGCKREIKDGDEDNPTLYECLDCHEFYEEEQFRKRGNCVGNQCRKCKNMDNKLYKSTLRGFIIKSLGTAKRCAEHKSVKRNDKSNEFNLTFDSICDKIIEQKGKCYYSDIPLVFEQNSDWMCSFERFDSSCGYTVDNVVLICIEFNSIDRIPTSVNEGTGSSQWTKEKVKYLFNNMPK